MPEIKVRCNVHILGFEAGDEFSTPDSEEIQGLLNIGYLTELVPVVGESVPKASKVKLSEPNGD